MPLTTYTAGEVLTAASLNANLVFAAANPVGGLSLISKTSFTTTATWTLDNIFTTTYDNYRIDIVWTALTNTANYAGFQMRVGGVAATGGNYQYAMAETNSSISCKASCIGLGCAP